MSEAAAILLTAAGIVAGTVMVLGVVALIAAGMVALAAAWMAERAEGHGLRDEDDLHA
jgi:hypothetical protein